MLKKILFLATFLCCFNLAYAQVQIKGQVLDEKSLEPIVGATIIAKENNKTAITDVNGNFVISVTSDKSVIIVKYTNYIDAEIVVGTQRNFNISLKEKSIQLDEFVVVGYGLQKKVNLTGSVASVDHKAIEDRPVVNIGQALQGAVANLNVSVGSGRASDSPSYNIRGTTSLTGGSPLIIIDGIVSNNDEMNRLNPNDISSISVLKDASSSAIYGSRAAFGVILVTTKIGSSEKLRVNYNSNVIFRNATRMMDVVTDPYTVAQVKNVMGAPWYNLFPEDKLAYAKQRSEDPSVSPYFENKDGSYSYFGTTDWFSELYQGTSIGTIHSVDISGRTDVVKYYMSVGYNFQDGLVKYGTDKYNRYNMRSKLDFQLAKWWTLGNNTSFVLTDYDYPQYLTTAYREINRQSSMDMMTNPDGSWTKTSAGIIGQLRDGGRWKNVKQNFSTQFDTKIDIIKDVFFIKSNFAYNTYNDAWDGYVSTISYKTGADLPAQYFNDITSAGVQTGRTKYISFDVYGTFMKTFAKDHAVTALVGFNQEESRYNYVTGSRKNLISTTLPSMQLAYGDPSVTQSINTWALRGAFARFNYTFKDKYMVEFNGRYDGTSRFPKDDRYAFNPSASIGWILSQEKFMESLQPYVSFLKIRASYGSLGNQDVGPYDYIPTMASGKISQILDGQQPQYVKTPGLVSASLTWEKVYTQNLGIDVNFFNNRLSATFDIYKRETKDMLTKGATLPSVLGAAMPNENAADLETKGWELTLGWSDNFMLASKTFQYKFGFNIADSRAYITKYANEIGNLDDKYVGQELGEIWGANTLGFFTSAEDIKNHADQSLVTSYPGTRPLGPGDLKFEDTDGSGKIDWGKWTTSDHGDWNVIGNSAKRYTFGFNGQVQWNGFDLSIFIQGVGKRDYYPGSSDLYFWGIYAQPWTNVTTGNYHDRWTEENPDPNAYYPRMKSYVAEQGSLECGVVQTKYLQNAAYARLKNLTFGYTLPAELTRKVGIDRVRVFFSGDNMAEISGLYKNYKVDPESLGSFVYPFQRSYSFGLNVTF